ncbi:type VI secretion system contractile sheath small subunit [Luteibacter sp.]|jgi:type VI secretion system protein ImpB|uniref:type VI secretion system contractile sheath small subunit n=1 Tax=Luteibacter sp. TaxID=1886636 RepID=UPI002F3F67AB
MAKDRGTQKKLEKVRAPRVQLTYEVERGDAIEARELPFVVGVLGDFAGQSPPAKHLRDRSFVNVDVDNFNDVMAGIAPSASFEVANVIDGDGRFHVAMDFASMDDFRPESVVKKVDPLRRLIEARGRLADLRNKMNGSDALEDLLADAIAKTCAGQLATPGEDA